MRNQILIDPENIVVPDNRQRKKFAEIENLAESISRNGLINPIVVREQGGHFTLVAGERRLRACLHLKLPVVECRNFKDLSQREQTEIELEENIKRSDLTWQEEVLAIKLYHEICSLDVEGWTAERTAENLNIAGSKVSRAILVGNALEEGNEKIASATASSAAYHILQRDLSRQLDNELAGADLAIAVQGEIAKSSIQGEEQISIEEILEKDSRKHPKTLRPAEKDVFVADAVEFFYSYDGPKFNLLNCDFPYGINLHKSDLYNLDTRGSYDDSPEVYFKLLDALFNNQNRIIADSAHCLFWFSMTYYEETVMAFSEEGWVVNPFPLVWLKADKKGILPDPQRGPRRIYETALLATRGDRKIVRAVPNGVCIESGRHDAVHPSEKPYLVMLQFLRMLCDEHSIFLDPTCGGGTALAVAEKLGAKSITGLDLNEEFVKESQRALRNARLSQAGWTQGDPREMPTD